MSKLVFLAVPYWLGLQDRDLSAIADVQASGIAEHFGADWYSISPELDENPVNGLNRALGKAVAQATAAGKIPFIIAGDCTACLGNMKGLEAYPTNVFWLDSHGDFNTPETSPSAFLGGMPLAAMVGLGNQDLLEGIAMQAIPESRVIITDARDLDPEEAELLLDSDVLHLRELSQVAEIDWQKKPLYIHFDSDVVRLEDLPAVSYPAQGGPTIDETIQALLQAIQTADVKAVHVTCWNNALEGAAQSRESVLKAISAMAEALEA